MKKTIFSFLLIVSALGLLAMILPRFVILLYAKPRTFTTKSVPPRRVAIVFGAGLNRDGTPALVLRDRVQTAVNLYLDGRVEKLLMSGDNRFVNYNEPEAMKQYALGLGVPEKDIVLDYAGRRTYDTCYRAKAIFGLDSAILVTQGFHLPRALYLCNMLGVDGIGVPADLQYYRKIYRGIWAARELLATVDSIGDILYRKPLPILGEPEPIFPDAP